MARPGASVRWRCLSISTTRAWRVSVRAQAGSRAGGRQWPSPLLPCLRLPMRPALSALLAARGPPPPALAAEAYERDLLRALGRTLGEGRHALVVIDSPCVTAARFKELWAVGQGAGYEVMAAELPDADPEVRGGGGGFATMA